MVVAVQSPQKRCVVITLVVAVWEQSFASQYVVAVVDILMEIQLILAVKSSKIWCPQCRECRARTTHQFKQIIQHLINDAMLSTDTDTSTGTPPTPPPQDIYRKTKRLINCV